MNTSHIIGGITGYRLLVWRVPYMSSIVILCPWTSNCLYILIEIKSGDQHNWPSAYPGIHSQVGPMTHDCLGFGCLILSDLCKMRHLLRTRGPMNLDASVVYIRFFRFFHHPSDFGMGTMDGIKEIIQMFDTTLNQNPMMLAVPCSRDGARRIAPVHFPLTWPQPSRSFLCVRDACSRAHLPP